MSELKAADVAAGATHDLRREVLRDGRADAEVVFAEDSDSRTRHVALVTGDGRAVAVATMAPTDCVVRPGRPAWRIRGMAVAPEWRDQGLGGRLLAEIESRAREAGVEVLWADGRDAALPFYRSHGWLVESEGYLTPDTGLAHHRIVRDLSP